MADISVNYCGILFKNPLVLASATPGWDGMAMRIAADAGIGAVIPKTIGPKQDWAAHPRNGRMYLHRVQGRPVGMINMELFTTKARDEWVNQDLAVAKQGGAVMQISILAMPNPEETAQLVEEIQSTGTADLFELNVSCPMPASTVGMHIGKSAEKTYEQLKAAKSAAKIPLTVKLTPNVADMTEIALAAQEAGADGITIANSIRSFAGVDIETGKPYLRGYGGYTGAAIRPITMRHFSEVARAVNIPLSAAGGVTSYREVIEYIMLGATTVQLCTEIMWDGYQVIPRIIADLNKWMDQKGYHSLDELRGIALSEITTVEKLAELPPKLAHIDLNNCVGCGKCKTVCMYRAIDKKETTYEVDIARCDGCGLCAQWCPKGAITLR